MQIGFGTGVASFASIVGLARQKIGALIGAVGCRVPFCQMFRQCNGLGRFQNTGTLGVDAFGLQTIFQLIFSWQGYIEWVVTVGKDSTQNNETKIEHESEFFNTTRQQEIETLKNQNKVVPNELTVTNVPGHRLDVEHFVHQGPVSCRPKHAVTFDRLKSTVPIEKRRFHRLPSSPVNLSKNLREEDTVRQHRFVFKSGGPLYSLYSKRTQT